MSLNPKQISLLAALLAQNAEFAVIGGVAVNAHGYSRSTSDIDVFIRPTVENAQLVFDALIALDYPLTELEPGDLLLDYDNVRFGPRHDRIDILPSIGNMSFDQVWRSRIVANFQGMRIPFICKQDLIQNKLEIGRLQDLADVEALTALDDDLFPQL